MTPAEIPFSMQLLKIQEPSLLVPGPKSPSELHGQVGTRTRVSPVLMQPSIPYTTPGFISFAQKAKPASKFLIQITSE